MVGSVALGKWKNAEPNSMAPIIHDIQDARAHLSPWDGSLRRLLVQVHDDVLLLVRHSWLGMNGWMSR